MKKLPDRYRQFKQEFPELTRAHEDIGHMVAETGPLGEKEIELIKLGMALAFGQEGAVHSHVRRAQEAGARPEEIRQVGLLGLTTVGFARTMAGLSWIDDILKGRRAGKRQTRRARRGP